MREIYKFLKRKQRGKVVSEKAYFKSNFRRYYAKHTDIGETEFWAHLTVPKNSHFTINGDNPACYLGKYNGKEVIKPENFYELPWDMQRGAQRLYKEFTENME